MDNQNIDRIPTVSLPQLCQQRRKKRLPLILLLFCTCYLLFCMVGVAAYSAESIFKGSYLFPILSYVNTPITKLSTLTRTAITAVPPLYIPVHTNTAISTSSTPANGVMTPTPTSAPIQPIPIPILLSQSDVCNGTALPSSRVPLQVPFTNGRRDFPEVALTFDDGPNPPYTSQILAILQNYHIHATFFTVGWQIETYPALVQQEANEGNLVENHSWSHANFTTLTVGSMNWQLTTTNDAVHKNTYIWPILFRPPYGAYNQTVLETARNFNLTTVTWDVDPADWMRPGMDVIISRVLSGTKNGSIILMHDGGGNRSQTVAALPTIIEQLQQRGFCLVTVQKLLDDLSPKS
jgi:peptidoglycan/xylan/chitin deacetylase (PgdA/CDA1 family)